ncbi:MAG: Asp23/Gls24 family envelope stress response protein [Angelakisella sp.]
MQDQKTIQPSAGSLKISQEVIASIAEYTVNEIEGVAGLAPITPSFTGWLLEKQTIKPVSIVITEGVAVIDIRICIKNDVRIPELSKKLQAAVKEAVQNMTGIVVSRVNLHIAGIVFPEAIPTV